MSLPIAADLMLAISAFHEDHLSARAEPRPHWTRDYACCADQAGEGSLVEAIVLGANVFDPKKGCTTTTFRESDQEAARLVDELLSPSPQTGYHFDVWTNAVMKTFKNIIELMGLDARRKRPHRAAHSPLICYDALKQSHRT